jgi:DNA-binding NarL/FixJ family response regulator
MLSILLADDHPSVLKGLERFFDEEDGFEVIGTAPDGNAAWECLERERPDIAVLDLVMPGMSGCEVAEKACEAEIPTRVIILTGTNRTETIYRCMQCGVGGFLLKTTDWENLADAARRISDGAVVICDEVMAALAYRIKVEENTKSLTERQQEVLRHIAKGMSLEQVGAAMHIAKGTVRHHMSEIYKQLEVRTQAAAVAEGFRRGILE